MEKYHCESDLCIYREIGKIPQFDTLEDSMCFDITIDENGKFVYLSTLYFSINPIEKELTSFINDLIEKELIPKNCNVGLWYLCEMDYSINVIGYYRDYEGDYDDEPQIDYFINLV
jgi:hypothetical protein